MDRWVSLIIMRKIAGTKVNIDRIVLLFIWMSHNNLWRCCYIGNYTNLVASDVCVNHAKARVVDMLWHYDSLRGVAISPKQILWLNSWTSFPNGSSLIPVDLDANSSTQLELDENNIVHLLLETELMPCSADKRRDISPVLVIYAITKCRIDVHVSLYAFRLRNMANQWHGKWIHVWQYSWSLIRDC